MSFGLFFIIIFIFKLKMLHFFENIFVVQLRKLKTTIKQSESIHEESCDA